MYVARAEVVAMHNIDAAGRQRVTRSSHLITTSQIISSNAERYWVFSGSHEQAGRLIKGVCIVEYVGPSTAS